MTIEPPIPDEIRVDDELVLRPVFEPRAEDLHELVHRNLAHLGEFLAWAQPDYDVDRVRAFQESRRDDWNNRGEQGFSIYFRVKLVGAVGLRGLELPIRAATIGYWLSEHVQGHGIMTRCVESLIRLAFETYDMNQVIIRAAPRNVRSRAIPERLGFTKTGIERQMAKNARGEFLDLVNYSLLQSEWKQG